MCFLASVFCAVFGKVLISCALCGFVRGAVANVLCTVICGLAPVADGFLAGCGERNALGGFFGGDPVGKGL